MANTNFNQIALILNGIAAQATGHSQIVPTNTAEFMSLATITLAAGYDPIMNAISLMQGRTHFSERAYKGKFASLMYDSQKWGAMERKLNLIDGEFDNDPSFELTDGVSVDMYKVNLPKPLQMNFYGSNVFKKYYTITLDQLNCAFRSADELASFWAMVTQNNADIIEQCRENTRRALVANEIASIYQYGNTEQVIHCLTEYNAETGLSLTAQTVFQPANYRPFMQWLYSRINTVAEFMTERTELYHMNISGKPIKRHTPKSEQKAFIYTPMKYQAQSMADANTYHEGLVGFASNEAVNFWQSVKTPGTVKVSPAYLDVSDGTVKSVASNSPITVENVIGCIFDTEHMGVTSINERTIATPINADGLYYNMYHHFTMRYFADATENFVLLLLD